MQSGGFVIHFHKISTL